MNILKSKKESILAKIPRNNNQYESVEKRFSVIPAQAGIHVFRCIPWIPAFAGMTNWVFKTYFSTLSLYILRCLIIDNPSAKQKEIS